eukprot:CAMPEP_0203969750 /NCGR_PEP_ID=MMETSP0359-20131031/97615_1 /ASSEMBLY_ACC=CAM_ASM_000338 /TAXON_ID=268821 /ORGANISM="Scrippsiella Hangoei, Strain SHTV-5" /LENGTH=376 /DNA_ID=CAMNT_0050907693 /DNA_START=47 /DNA_END=1177 /DNA_ORIENTATION=-
MSGSSGGDEDWSKMPPVIHAMIHEDEIALDPDADSLLPILRKSAAPEIWHKHGHFYSHLHDVWHMLCAWKQPQAVCRLGLFHSAYSNSFVSMNLYNPDTPAGRAELREVIGAAAEEFVWKFCVINRQEMEQDALNTGKIPAEGKDFAHIRTGEAVHCSAAEIGVFLVETIADYQDQSFGWQSEMEAGHTDAIWPGLFKPTLRMSKVSKMAVVAKEYGHLEVVPPVFNNCSTILTEQNELEARDLYWSAVSEGSGGKQDDLIAKLTRASELNPFVAEPHAVRAQLLMQKGDWSRAADAAKSGLRLFYEWATQWDNRMPFTAWVSWTRCILLQSSFQEWPSTHGGMESLGAVHPSQKFRKLNDGRSFGEKPKAEEVEK